MFAFEMKTNCWTETKKENPFKINSQKIWKNVFFQKKRRQIENENLLLLFPSFFSFFQKYWLRFKIFFFVFYSPTGPLCQILSIKTFSIMTMEQHAFKIVNNCLNTNNFSSLQTSGGQSSNPYLNAVHFFNTRVKQKSVAA